MSRKHAQFGISLIEVIVALVIISGFGAALFVWAGQTLQTSNRALLALDEVEIDRNVSELCISINPAEQPQGHLDTERYSYDWTSTISRKPQDHVKHPFGLSPFQVGLYKVTVRVEDKAGRESARVIERLIAGFQQVRIRPGPPPGFAEAASP